MLNIPKLGQQGPTYSTENHTQYLVINHHGKEYEKEYIYTHIHIYIFAMQ